jgi:hypothetical protein
MTASSQENGTRDIMRLTPEQLANEKVAKYIVHLFKTDSPYSPPYHTGPEADHLRKCSTVYASPKEGYDGAYGCETGCEYARLEAIIYCQDGVSIDYKYGEFGELADILQDMELTDL